MTFEVAPAPVGAGHWRVAILAVALFAAAVVGSAAMTRPPSSTLQKAASVPAASAPRLPARLDCHDLARSPCETATRTALSLFAASDGQVIAAGAWRSIVCADNLACPPSLVTPDATPVGSVIVTFANGPAAWINVMSRPEPSLAGPVARPYAWVVRWR